MLEIYQITSALKHLSWGKEVAVITDARFAGEAREPEEGARVLASRPPRPDLAPDKDLPDDTRLWALVQQAGGGTWGGCVYDVDASAAALARKA